MPHEDLLLETKGLTKVCNGFAAVNGVDLRVRRGSINALIGAQRCEQGNLLHSVEQVPDTNLRADFLRWKGSHESLADSDYAQRRHSVVSDFRGVSVSEPGRERVYRIAIRARRFLSILVEYAYAGPAARTRAGFARSGRDRRLQGVPRGKLFGVLRLDNDLTLYFLVLAISVAAFLFIGRVVDSPFGRILTALKENEARATSLGYDVQRFKLLAFVISATLAGLAGAMKTLVFGFATRSDVYWTTSGTVSLMTLLGGLGTRFGPVVGAVIVGGIESKLDEFAARLASITHITWFQGLGESVSLLTGVTFVCCVPLFRRRIVGECRYWFERSEFAKWRARTPVRDGTTCSS
jgi:hypothetical protein